MRKRLSRWKQWGGSLLLLAAACDGPQSKLSLEAVAQLRAEGMKESCVQKLREGDFEGKVGTGPEECFEMMPPQRWKGLWRDDFEGSQFCVVPAKTCAFEGQQERVWIDWPRANQRHGGLYQVEFIGRRTKHPSQHGHMGVFDHAMIVEKVISMQEVEQPPPEPTKAEMIEHWKECEATRSCIPDWEAINQMGD